MYCAQLLALCVFSQIDFRKLTGGIVNDIIPASNLPAVPASRAVVAPSNISGRHSTGNVVRRVAAEYSLNARWRGMAAMASHDPSLKGYVPPVRFPIDYGQPLLGRADYTFKDFDPCGQWVYIRLHYLVTNVVTILASAEGSHPLSSVRVALDKYRDLLLWNAAADLILAQRIVAAEEYNPLRNLMGPSLKPIAVNGVAELRGRVLYIVDALDLIYRLALQCERFQRSQEQVIITSELEDALAWFQSFMEVAERMREPEEEPKPAKNPPFWQRWRQ